MTTAVLARDGSETTGTAPSRVHFGGFEILRAVAAVMVVVSGLGPSKCTSLADTLILVLVVFDNTVATSLLALGGALVTVTYTKAVSVRAGEPLSPMRYMNEA